MNEITSIDFATKVQALQAIHILIPAAVEFAVEQVGFDGVKTFFNDYKAVAELALQAA
jgi:hypothetical protein